MTKTTWKEKAKRVSRCVKGVSHEIRLGILLALREGEKSVNALVDEIECPQPTLSQHLSVMRERGIVVARREANQVIYRVSDRRIFKLLDLLQLVFCSQGEES